MSREDEARDEVRDLVRRYHNERKLDRSWEQLDGATQSALYRAAENDLDDRTDPYDAARRAVRKVLGVG